MEKYLLDTHVLLWFVADDDRLSKDIKNLILDNHNLIHISHASFWEISIKLSLKKLKISSSFEEFYKCVQFGNVEILSFSEGDYQNLLRMPFNHRDPFDRMLVAQALTRNITIISKDNVLKSYGVDVIF